MCYCKTNLFGVRCINLLLLNRSTSGRYKQLRWWIDQLRATKWPKQLLIVCLNTIFRSIQCFSCFILLFSVCFCRIAGEWNPERTTKTQFEQNLLLPTRENHFFHRYWKNQTHSSIQKKVVSDAVHYSKPNTKSSKIKLFSVTQTINARQSTRRGLRIYMYIGREAGQYQRPAHWCWNGSIWWMGSVFERGVRSGWLRRQRADHHRRRALLLHPAR